MEQSLPVLTTWMYRGCDSNSQPSACGANALTQCTLAAVDKQVKFIIFGLSVELYYMYLFYRHISNYNMEIRTKKGVSCNHSRFIENGLHFVTYIEYCVHLYKMIDIQLEILSSLYTRFDYKLSYTQNMQQGNVDHTAV